MIAAMKKIHLRLTVLEEMRGRTTLVEWPVQDDATWPKATMMRSRSCK